MDDMWATRHEAEAALREPLQQEAAVVDMGFRILDLCAAALKVDSIDNSFAWVCGGFLAKGRNLGLACYSLSLDGLAQEGGAVLRPLVEVIEMLLYLSQDASRVDRVLQGKLPKAGKIGQAINGPFQPLRNYLNSHVSHIDFTYESMRHLFDVKSDEWRDIQRHDGAVLRENLRTLWVALSLLARGVVRCLEVCNVPTDEIAEMLEDWENLASPIFGFPLPGAALPANTPPNQKNAPV